MNWSRLGLLAGVALLSGLVSIAWCGCTGMFEPKPDSGVDVGDADADRGEAGDADTDQPADTTPDTTPDVEVEADAEDGDGPPSEYMAPGESVSIDFGGTSTTDVGWNNVNDSDEEVANAVASEGEATNVTLTVTDAFEGTNEHGIETNELGLPPTVSGDSLWTGSHDSHEIGLERPAQVTVSGLDPLGRFTIELFSSRAGPDELGDRLTRYTIGDQWQDFDVTDNTSELVSFYDVLPDADGLVVLDIGVSPAGLGRYGYLGALFITRVE